MVQLRKMPQYKQIQILPNGLKAEYSRAVKFYFRVQQVRALFIQKSRNRRFHRARFSWPGDFNTELVERLQSRREMAKKRSFIFNFQAADFVAVVPYFQNYFHDIVNVALRVNPPRDG